MKLRDIINNLDKSSTNTEWISIGDIASSEFGLDCWQFSENTRLKCYWVANHLCTDTVVGIRAYFLDDKIAAVSVQGARKSPEVFQWLNKEVYNLVGEYLKSLMINEDESFDIDFIDLDSEEILEGYRVYYSCQLLTSKVIYNGILCNVLRKIDTYKDPDLEIEYRGVPTLVNTADVLVPWKVKQGSNTQLNTSSEP